MLTPEDRVLLAEYIAALEYFTSHPPCPHAFVRLRTCERRVEEILRTDETIRVAPYLVGLEWCRGSERYRVVTRDERLLTGGLKYAG